MGDPHLMTDRDRLDREVLVEVFEQGEAFAWDIALILGDFSAGEWPTQAECDEIARQFAAAFAASAHHRGQVYTIAGNHDADIGMVWFQTCLDPIGQTGRPYPVTGTFDHYTFETGNLRFLMMSDRNDVPRRFGGRGLETDPNRGGYPAGKMKPVTFEWLKGEVTSDTDNILIAAHHHMLFETTLATERWGGVYWRYHGAFVDEGFPECASYLCIIGPDKRPGAIPAVLAANPGRVALWLGGHTHPRAPGDYTVNHHGVRRGVIEQAHGGTWFVNAAALTLGYAPGPSMSKLITFTDGSQIVIIQTIIHDPGLWAGQVGPLPAVEVDIGRVVRLP